MSTYTTGLIILGIICAAGIFFSFISGIQKSFKPLPDSIHHQSENTKRQQRESIEETEEKRRQLMDDLKQKIRDGRNRNF